MKTISQVAQLTGVSVRTLQYYDEIDLLKPAAVTDAGYRMYDEAALERLQQILFFRELDFRLKEIKEIMENPEYDKQEVFRKQKKMIRAKRDRLTRLLKLLDKLEKGEDCMSFDAFDLTEYFELMENFKQQNEEEVIRVWGSVENYERLINKVKADEQRVGELAVKYYGSTENYTRVIEEGLNKIPDIINDAWTQKTNSLYRKLTGDLTRDARSEEVQAIVRELMEHTQGRVNKQGWKKLVESGFYTGHGIKEENDALYGAGASEFMEAAMKEYFSHISPEELADEAGGPEERKTEK